MNSHELVEESTDIIYQLIKEDYMIRAVQDISYIDGGERLKPIVVTFI